MIYDFSADEVFEMAEQLERNGISFYKTAAERADDTEIKALLQKLAGMEEQHEQIFTSMRKRLSEKERQGTVFDPEGEAVQYLHALADTRVFFKKEVDVSSKEEVLKSAMVAEKDSIVFYLGMKEAVPDKLGKDHIEAIIKEEMSHIRLLGNELARLK